MPFAPWVRAFLLPGIALFAVLVTLLGCSLRQQNQVVAKSPEGITIRYDSRFPTMAGVDADEHCAEFGKVAKRVATNRPSSLDTISHPHAAQGVFECVNAE